MSHLNIFVSKGYEKNGRLECTPFAGEKESAMQLEKQLTPLKREAGLVG